MCNLGSNFELVYYVKEYNILIEKRNGKLY